MAILLTNSIEEVPERTSSSIFALACIFNTAPSGLFFTTSKGIAKETRTIFEGKGKKRRNVLSHCTGQLPTTYSLQ